MQNTSLFLSVSSKIIGNLFRLRIRFFFSLLYTQYSKPPLEYYSLNFLAIGFLL